jgi:hypothetical protein
MGGEGLPGGLPGKHAFPAEPTGRSFRALMSNPGKSREFILAALRDQGVGGSNPLAPTNRGLPTEKLGAIGFEGRGCVHSFQGSTANCLAADRRKQGRGPAPGRLGRLETQRPLGARLPAAVGTKSSRPDQLEHSPNGTGAREFEGRDTPPRPACFAGWMCRRGRHPARARPFRRPRSGVRVDSGLSSASALHCLYFQALFRKRKRQKRGGVHELEVYLFRGTCRGGAAQPA